MRVGGTWEGMQLFALFILVAAVGADAPKTKGSKSKTSTSSQSKMPRAKNGGGKTSKRSAKHGKATATDATPSPSACC